eukprot:4480821-Pleurochrysis_carterae.AAC.1
MRGEGHQVGAEGHQVGTAGHRTQVERREAVRAVTVTDCQRRRARVHEACVPFVDGACTLRASRGW